MLKPGIEIRIALGLFGVVSAIFLPWWATLGIIVALSLFWRAGEAIFLGLAMDFLWSPVHAAPLFTCSAIFIAWIFEPIRKELLAR